MNKERMNPTIFSLTSVLVGMLITDELSYVELNALGNWLVLLGDYLLTYASQEYLILQNQMNLQNQNKQDELSFLYSALKKMEKEIEQIKKETN